MCRWSVFFQIIWLQCTQDSDSMCLCTHKLCLLRASSSGICECACVTAASLLISSLPRGLLCFSAFFFFFLLFFLRLKEQQAVTAPWALTDHSPQPGCQRSSNTQGSYGSFAGKLQLWTIEQHVLKQPPPLLIACYTTLCCCFQRRLRWRPKEEILDLFKDWL